jgi:hypothetical protein
MTERRSIPAPAAWKPSDGIVNDGFSPMQIWRIRLGMGQGILYRAADETNDCRCGGHGKSANAGSFGDGAIAKIGVCVGR